MDVGHCTVADWNKKKLIPHFRDERIIRYAPENVLAFILSKTVSSRTATFRMAPTYQSPAPAIQTLPDETWKRIERLIADQLRAQLLAERKERAA